MLQRRSSESPRHRTYKPYCSINTSVTLTMKNILNLDCLNWTMTTWLRGAFKFQKKAQVAQFLAPPDSQGTSMLCIKAPCQALSILAEQKKGNKQRDRQELRTGWGSALPAARSALSAGLSLLLPSFLALWLRLPSYATSQPQQKGGMWHWHKRLRDWRKLLGCRVTTLQCSDSLCFNILIF